MKDTVECLENLTARYTYDVLLEQFKYYITDVMFYVTGGITGSLDRRDTNTGNLCVSTCSVMSTMSRILTFIWLTSYLPYTFILKLEFVQYWKSIVYTILPRQTLEC